MDLLKHHVINTGYEPNSVSVISNDKNPTGPQTWGISGISPSILKWWRSVGVVLLIAQTASWPQMALVVEQTAPPTETANIKALQCGISAADRRQMPSSPLSPLLYHRTYMANPSYQDPRRGCRSSIRVRKTG